MIPSGIHFRCGCTHSASPWADRHPGANGPGHFRCPSICCVRHHPTNQGLWFTRSRPVQGGRI
ncbi:uncharacterized protein STAUR_5174 [Stigmatella aurantiaca DW4/3-1]|uniref:Uncharacterized protein n=1 Tax=Stigmatella aurantiaca (strain DW4/3-1) TaxID=378806 RepID=E3FJT4_STIAD|nr:uncharacterized protein STAUR_5174 [Stigmatella aurantiaca DW4/3-1]